MHRNRLIHRIAVCGPARTVMWQGEVREDFPYANLLALAVAEGLGKKNSCVVYTGATELAGLF